MKSMKDMKKAVAIFRGLHITVLDEVGLQPLHFAHLPVWPKAKPLHVLPALHGIFSFLYLLEPLGSKVRIEVDW